MTGRVFLLLALTMLLTLPAPRMSAGNLTSPEEASFEKTRGSRLSWARLKFPTTGFRRGDSLGWFYHPSGDIIIVNWLRTNTTINMMLEWNIADIDNLEQMTDFPLLFLSGKGAISPNAKQKANLKEYLLRGGFLFVDDCVALRQIKEDLFFDSVKALLQEILPGVQFRKLPLSDRVFHSYYDINDWAHLQGVNNGLWGAWDQGRLVALMNSSDLHCGWVGFHFSKRQKDFALRMAANIYVYSMFH
ncbi:MAG: DUF4159 domain-containing protein [Victivallaceae bacterium]|nr:DUF4159 domain-containing protein [Victivallaceae bacterium]